MNLKLLSASLLLASALPCLAGGSVTNNPDNRPYFGIRLGGEITCPGDVNYKYRATEFGLDLWKNGGGVEFGVIYNQPLVCNLYIEPGLKFYYNAYSADLDALDEYGDYEIGSSYVGKFGLRIPINFGYHFDFTDNLSLAIFTGPELEFGLSAKEHTKAEGLKMSENLYGEDGIYNRVDVNWGIGVGLNINRSFYVGLSGDIGLLNMYKKNDAGATFHENRVTLSIGYNF